MKLSTIIGAALALGIMSLGSTAHAATYLSTFDITLQGEEQFGSLIEYGSTYEATDVQIKSGVFNLGSNSIDTFPGGLDSLYQGVNGTININAGNVTYQLAYLPQIVGPGGNSLEEGAFQESYGSEASILTITPVISAAPEPSIWLLMIAGVATIGAGLRYGRKQELACAAA